MVTQKKWFRPVLLSVGGGLAGLFYYYFFGCKTGCAITSSPYITTLYLALAGFLLSVVFRKEAG